MRPFYRIINFKGVFSIRLMKQAHHKGFYVIIFGKIPRQGNNNKWSNENNVSFIIKGPNSKGIDWMDMFVSQMVLSFFFRKFHFF